MKLSEAIRLGAMLWPQAYFANSGLGTCALEAAGEALGVIWSRLHDTYPVLRDYTMCPILGKKRVVEFIIWDLNDCKHWTRERIADWVGECESRESAPISDLREVVALNQ